MALSSTHLFLMRNIIHHYNCHKNKQRLCDIKKAFDTKIAMNIQSQAVLGNFFKFDYANLSQMQHIIIHCFV